MPGPRNGIGQLVTEVLHSLPDDGQSKVDTSAQFRSTDELKDVPLVVDLDGSLCRCDTFHEGLIALAARRPMAFPGLILRLKRGRSDFKRHIADQVILDPALLPYNSAVLAQVKLAREQGRYVALVSAADHRQVEAIADHLGLFDLAIGTGSPGTEGNLRGVAKAAFLVARFGEKGFDYVGDSAVDFPVWHAARQATCVRPSSTLRRRALAEGLSLSEIGDEGVGRFQALLRACRPHQWAKNLLIFLPVLTAQDLSGVDSALLAFVCFSLTASAIYIVNDLLDLPADRIHLRKRRRPFASGDATVAQGLTLTTGLLAVSLGLAALVLPMGFLGVLLVYLTLTLLYSFVLKRKMMVDVIGLATLYTLRIVAGGSASGIVLSPWLLVFSMFLFFALATIKRQSELEDLSARGGEKTVGRNLIVADLPVYQSMSVASAQAAVLVFAMYSQDLEVQSHFGSPDLLLLICPVLMFWLGRMQILTRRGFMTDDPIVFTLRDRISLLAGITMLSVFVAAAVGLPA